MNDTQTLSVGDAAPDFQLMDQDRNTVKLADYRGKTVILLFYPMDFSPTCTTEHCNFGPALSSIAPGDDTVVFGVNCDHPFSHAAYRKQYNIPYPLLSDTSREMCKAYGMFSGVEPFNCAKRGTIVIGPDGNIKAVKGADVGEVREVEDIAAMAR